MEYLPYDLKALMGHLRDVCTKQENAKLTWLDRIQYGPWTFKSFIKNNKKQIPNWFSEANIKSIMLDILKGLKYLDSKHFLHRDLKPSNVLIDKNGIAKLADFGLARRERKEKESKTEGRNVVTRYYRSPELLLGEVNYDTSVDVWRYAYYPLFFFFFVFWFYFCSFFAFKGTHCVLC